MSRAPFRDIGAEKCRTRRPAAGRRQRMHQAAAPSLSSPWWLLACLLVLASCQKPDDLAPGNGLRGMRERLQALGGGLELGRTDTGGVHLQAWLPVAA